MKTTLVPFLLILTGCSVFSADPTGIPDGFAQERNGILRTEFDDATCFSASRGMGVKDYGVAVAVSCIPKTPACQP